MLPFLEDIDVKNKKVLLRVDFNTPLHNGKLLDDSRIVAHLQTLEWLRQQKAKVILITHLGRPDGNARKALSLAPIAQHLSALLGQKVPLAPGCLDATTQAMVHNMEKGDIILLENIRFEREEEENIDSFAKKLAAMGDVYVNDAFAVSHRAHASLVGIPAYVETCAIGHLMKKELDALEHVLEHPKEPAVYLIGGAKISSKIDVLHNLLPKANMMMIGGAMANTFLASMGHHMGTSLYESDYLQIAGRILTDSAAMGCRLLLPIDLVSAKEMTPHAPTKIVPVDKIPQGHLALDIGPATTALWARMLGTAGTILWNGPMGVTEVPPFNAGTCAIAQAVADSKAYSVAGGGDTLSALAKTNLRSQIDYISTGGGALISALEGKPLPGVKAIEDKKEA